MAVKLPRAVTEAFKVIKGKHAHASISRIGNGFYVVESIARYSKEKGRNITATLYLGRILPDGGFVKARHRKAKNDVSSVYALARSRTGEERWGGGLDDTDYRILEQLSNDSRVSMADIAKELGISQSGAANRVGRLEKKLGITYAAEVQTAAFGLLRFAVMVKFTSWQPDMEKVREYLEADPLVLTAFATKGSYDLFIIAVGEDIMKFEKWLYTTRTSTVFAHFTARWAVSYMVRELGYIPLRDKFFDHLKENIWKKSKETPVKEKRQLFEREYLVLKELNRNGNADFSDIDKKYGLGKGAAQYTFHKLVERKIISRTTVNIGKAPIKYVAIIHADQKNMKSFVEEKERYYRLLVTNESTVANKCTLVFAFGAPYGELIFAPVYDDTGLEKLEGEIMAIRGFGVRSSVITSTLVGELGIRRLVNFSYSPYSILIRDYGYSEERLRAIVQSR